MIISAGFTTLIFITRSTLKIRFLDFYKNEFIISFILLDETFKKKMQSFHVNDLKNPLIGCQQSLEQ